MMTAQSRLWLASVLIFGILACCRLAIAQPIAESAQPDVAKGAQLYDQGDALRGIVACASCHGVAGNSLIAANPNLASMSHEYLAKQLMDFQVRPGAEKPVRMGANGEPSLMTLFVQSLTPGDIQNIAVYLAEQPLRHPAAADHPEFVERGRQIWRGGLPEQGVPACAACHAANGAGVPAQFPRLAGQFPSYIENQLMLFRDHSRSNIMMSAVAERLSNADIKAVSDYAAGLR